ncbi:MAG: hypothetical protein CMH22_06285 [Methylophaga sp.]|nr:hypothetical protein [Methylophaga sp.]|tara:strand:- start:33377 stop:33997 length:621 start_codon:yes stop_codon:yes gene_type:complete
MSKFKNIVKSRFIKGESLPDWYEKRLSICASCELNSKNIEDKSGKRMAWEFIAGAHCTAPTCGCSISQKAKIEEESCPIGKWGKEAEPQVLDQGFVKITNNSANKVTIQKQGIAYYLDYGTIMYNADSSVNLELEFDRPIYDTNLTTTCGCTKSQVKEKEKNKYSLTIQYDTTRVGRFEKPIIFKFKHNNVNTQLRFVIKGNVIKN